MHARSVTFSSTQIISNLQASVESIILEFQQIQTPIFTITDANSLESLEAGLHEKAAKLADLIAAKKLQETLDTEELSKAEKDLLKSHPKKMKNMGRRTVNIRMLSGTLITILVTYYHQKSDSKSRCKKGFYPKLLLLGIHDRCTQALSSRCSLFATAASSFEEAQRLMRTLYGFNLNIKKFA
jgi:hypothetical protein